MMKTIEQKAKAYDEALEKAKCLIANEETNVPVFYVENIKDIFPELKESEDEKIRKDIIVYLQYSMAFDKSFLDKKYNWSQKDCSKWIAWLEKQGEQKPANKKEEVDNLHNYLYGEQKPTDNVEPKFKVGDWVINTITKEVEQVIELTGSEYICSGHLIISYNEQHLLKSWTIQDAKDGDVLSFNDGHGNDCIELIKSITGKKIEFWFCLTNGNRYEVFDGIIPYTNLVSREDATPATKEQCDLLFQKMKEAGYEWDADKLQLKKIEQKPAFDIEIPFGIDSGLIEKFITIPEGCYAVIEGNQVVIRKGEKPATKLELDENGEPILTPFESELFSMMSDAWQGYQLGEEVNIAEIVKEHSSELLERANKQKHAWSEEDEEILNLIIARLHSHPSVEAEEYGKDYHWFKSLKDRVQPKPQQEWSEEDRQMRMKVLKYISTRCNVFEYEEVESWINSIRPQSHWKPSKEQVEALNTCLVEGQINHVGQGEKLQSLYNELKILK